MDSTRLATFVIDTHIDNKSYWWNIAARAINVIIVIIVPFDEVLYCLGTKISQLIIHQLYNDRSTCIHGNGNDVYRLWKAKSWTSHQNTGLESRLACTSR